MSTAILFSGQLRSFASCYPTQKWQVFRHYPDAHFFFCVQNNEQVNSLAAIKRDYPDRVHVKLMDDPILPEIPLSFGAHAPYANAAPHNRLLLQFWYNLQVFDFMASEQLSGKCGSFDTFIRMRPDNWMQEFTKPKLGDIKEVHVPSFAGFGGINDRFAVMDSDTAAIYFTLYNGIEALLAMGCPFHPETLLAEHLRRHRITIRSCYSVFRTQRMDGSAREPEISHADYLKLGWPIGSVL